MDDPKVITVDKNDSLGSALRLMRENRIRRLPVVSGGKLVGIVSDRDLKGPSRRARRPSTSGSFTA